MSQDIVVSFKRLELLKAATYELTHTWTVIQALIEAGSMTGIQKDQPELLKYREAISAILADRKANAERELNALPTHMRRNFALEEPTR